MRDALGQLALLAVQFQDVEVIALDVLDLEVQLGAGLQPGLWSELYLWLLLALAIATVINRARQIVAKAKGRAA